MQALYDLVKHFEGLHDGDKKTPVLEPVMCPAGKWTAGWGFVLTDPKTGRQYAGKEDRGAAFAEWRRRWPNGMTLADADAQLAEDMAKHSQRIKKLVKVEITEAQLDALTTFDYNTGGLASSTMLKKLNAGDKAGASAEFPKWNKATVDGKKVVLAGLVTRRAAEQLMFDGADWRGAVNPSKKMAMPQAVAAPVEMKPLSESRTIKGIASSVGIATVAPVISEISDNLKQVQGIGDQVKDLIGLFPPNATLYIVIAALAGGLAYAAYRRWDDAKKMEG